MVFFDRLPEESFSPQRIAFRDVHGKIDRESAIEKIVAGFAPTAS